MDKLNRQIVLLSESNKDYPPIYINENDFDDYLANAKVVDVLKSPKSTEVETTFEKNLDTFFHVAHNMLKLLSCGVGENTHQKNHF